MPWSEYRYQQVKQKCKEDIDRAFRTCSDYMMEYKKAVRQEDYEACNAITEVLAEYGFKTADTHRYIRELNKD